MAFIGNIPTQQAFTPAIDYFSGTGSATAFTLSRPVASVAQVQVTIDNVAQNPSSAYTVSGSTITFTSAPLSGTNNIYVYYTSPITDVIAPGQGTVVSSSFGTITDFTTTGNTVLGDATTDTLTVGVTGIVKNSSGNVGIGTASPSEKLDVQSSGDLKARVYTSGTTVSTHAGLALKTGSYEYLIQNLTTTASSAGALRFYDITASAERMRIDSSGNVGIGTASPSQKLQVLATNTTGFAGAAIQNQNTNVGIAGVQFSSDTTYFKSAIGQVRSDANGVGSLVFYNASSTGAANWATSDERMRIDSSGVVLVGQTSTFSQGSPIFVAGSSSSNQPIGHRGYGGVDGTYVDWLISAPYQGNTTEQNRIKSSISSGASNSGLQFWISDGAGASTQTQSFRINRTSCTVVGSLSKGSGSFKIDHPLTAKKDTHHLVHSFIEGPQADLIYRGKVNLVNGTATVNIDTTSGMTEGTFVALCRNVQCFTTNESDWTPVRGSVAGNILTIEAQDNTSTASISWMVIGERQDKHMYETDWTDENGKVIVEPLKETLENR